MLQGTLLYGLVIAARGRRWVYVMSMRSIIEDIRHTLNVANVTLPKYNEEYVSGGLDDLLASAERTEAAQSPLEVEESDDSRALNDPSVVRKSESIVHSPREHQYEPSSAGSEETERPSYNPRRDLGAHVRENKPARSAAAREVVIHNHAGQTHDPPRTSGSIYYPQSPLPPPQHPQHQGAIPQLNQHVQPRPSPRLVRTGSIQQPPPSSASTTSTARVQTPPSSPLSTSTAVSARKDSSTRSRSPAPQRVQTPSIEVPAETERFTPPVCSSCVVGKYSC